MMDYVLSFDKYVFQFIESHFWHEMGLDKFMPFITKLGDGGIIWIAIAILFLIFKKTRKIGICVAIALALHMLVNDLILKNLFSRPRPFNYEAWKSWFTYPDFIPKLSSYSFPSGHTCSSFAAATALCYYKKWYVTWPALILAFLIGISRIYVHVHYASDVIAGMVIGVLLGFVAVSIIEKIDDILAKRKETQPKKV